MKTYVKHRNEHNILKTRQILEEIPDYCSLFINGIEVKTTAYTRLQYAQYLKTFFVFLTQNNVIYKNYRLRDIPITVLDSLKPCDIDEYLHWLGLYKIDDTTYQNGENGKAAKLSALSAFYQYLAKHEIIEKNPVSLVNRPKLHTKNIITLSPNEVAIFLDKIEAGEGLSSKQAKWHEQTVERDVAIATLLLGTGIRVSELVGLDLTDVDFENNCISIIRKGGNEDIVYFSDEVAESLFYYLETGRPRLRQYDNENSLFLSIRGTRLAVRSVQAMIKKYALKYVPGKHITAHKLRSTYGTQLYEETGDIYLVANTLDHKDINTSARHYVKQSESKKRYAGSVISLRERV